MMKYVGHFTAATQALNTTIVSGRMLLSKCNIMIVYPECNHTVYITSVYVNV